MLKSFLIAAAVILAPESGVEYGVSGAFGGMMGETPVRAGGCNFPYDDPVSVVPSAKRYYSGIYNGLTGERIGALPVRTAYGASAQTEKGLVMAGGQTRDVWLLKADGSLHSLPKLPHMVDNAYGAALGNTVYLCGGHADGRASTALLRLDLDRKKAKWEHVADMPGRGRVQPVMAASGGRLYIWGGYDDGEEKEVMTDGLCYDPQTGSWSLLPEPAPGVTLAGGVAVALSDGRIVCSGGVNRKIFLEAITDQAEDYLEHPVQWYRFNGKTYIFHPSDLTWSKLDYNPDRARAGAAAALLPDGTVLIMGGELKPRVRATRPAIM